MVPVENIANSRWLIRSCIVEHPFISNWRKLGMVSKKDDTHATERDTPHRRPNLAHPRINTSQGAVTDERHFVNDEITNIFKLTLQSSLRIHRQVRDQIGSAHV